MAEDYKSKGTCHVKCDEEGEKEGRGMNVRLMYTRLIKRQDGVSCSRFFWSAGCP